MVRANSRAASIWGISRASLLNSLAIHALPLTDSLTKYGMQMLQ
jgi:hypothetical protein